MAQLDRGVSSVAASALQDQLAECRRDCLYYRRRLVQANKALDLLREMRDFGEALPMGLQDALEEYDALPLEP